MPRSQRPLALEIRGELETQVHAVTIRSGDLGLTTSVDWSMEHADWRMALIRARTDLSTAFRGGSWLTELRGDL